MARVTVFGVITICACIFLMMGFWFERYFMENIYIQVILSHALFKIILFCV